MSLLPRPPLRQQTEFSVEGSCPCEWRSPLDLSTMRAMVAVTTKLTVRPVPVSEPFGSEISVSALLPGTAVMPSVWFHTSRFSSRGEPNNYDIPLSESLRHDSTTHRPGNPCGGNDPTIRHTSNHPSLRQSPEGRQDRPRSDNRFSLTGGTGSAARFRRSGRTIIARQ